MRSMRQKLPSGPQVPSDLQVTGWLGRNRFLGPTFPSLLTGKVQHPPLGVGS